MKLINIAKKYSVKIVFSLLAITALSACNCAKEANITNVYKASDLEGVRDPYIFADAKSGYYYLQLRDFNCGLKVYRSKDLENWENLGRSFVLPKDFWGKSDICWAPDMFERNGKYYVITTFGGDTSKPFAQKGMRVFRGSAVLVSDKPEGPYTPLTKTAITPANWMSLDATLYEEDGKLYIIYCHEWEQVKDGEIVAQEISKDLTKTIGEPKLLFKASEASWVKKNPNCMVTDGCVINRADDGTLYMTWSSFAKNGKYVIGFATSDNGKLFGKWKHAEQPLNNDDGGHAMIFKTFDGKTKISYHAPNKFPEKLVIKDFEVKNGKAEIK